MPGRLESISAWRPLLLAIGKVFQAEYILPRTNHCRDVSQRFSSNLNACRQRVPRKAILLSAVRC
jgi:hypothetical protein